MLDQNKVLGRVCTQTRMLRASLHCSKEIRVRTTLVFAVSKHDV